MSLELFLERNALARRLFGEREIDIAVRQMKGLPLTASERVRLSRDIRPKLELVRELAAFGDEFALKKNKANETAWKRAVDEIRRDAVGREAVAVLLFGSQVTGEKTRRSDVDIAVVFGRAPDRKTVFGFESRLNGAVEGVHVSVFEALPPRVKAEIARNHRVLFAGKGFDEAGLEARALMAEEDYRIIEREATA